MDDKQILLYSFLHILPYTDQPIPKQLLCLLLFHLLGLYFYRYSFLQEINYLKYISLRFYHPKSQFHIVFYSLYLLQYICILLFHHEKFPFDLHIFVWKFLRYLHKLQQHSLQIKKIYLLLSIFQTFQPQNLP